ncbi:MAG: hypothetical protein ACRDJG_01750 [Actinomycetota bacterium]
MIKYGIAYEGGFSGSREAAESQFDLVMEELVRLGAGDPWIGLTLKQGGGKVEITMTVEADTREDALIAGTSFVRSALHAAGAFTPVFELETAKLVPAC